MPASQAVPSRATADRPLLADDGSAIRLLALPDLGPPFDDDPAAARAVAEAVAARYGAPGLDAAALSARHGAARHGAAGHAAARTGAAATNLGGDGEWARQFARLLTEALSGDRPMRQILPWTSHRAGVQVRDLMPLFAGGQRPRLLRVIATRPARDVIEMTVIAGLGTRTRALAVRLQRADPADAAGRPRWLCTDIEAA